MRLPATIRTWASACARFRRCSTSIIARRSSTYESWWGSGWSCGTACAMARVVFSNTFDKYPRLRILVHHVGGIVPMLEGRIGPGWDVLGSRTTDEDYVALRKSLNKRPRDS